MNNKRRIYMDTKLKILAFIVSLPIPESYGMPTRAPVGVQLIGLYNTLTKNSNDFSANPATVRIKTTREAVTGLPWIPQEFLKLPIEIEVLFAAKNLDDKGVPQPYVIRLEENATYGGSCPADKTCVTAHVYANQLGDLDAYPTAQQSTCVSKSVFFIQMGDMISQWQNLMLFIADPDDPTSPVPFKFGICAWTATHGLWKYDFIDYAPADMITQAPKVIFDTQPTPTGNSQLDGLQVFQGQQAWGGGPLPRAYFVHIAHLYNNTPYQILVRRTVRELSSYNFVKIVPPHSVIPFAMIWVPKIAADEAGLPRLDPIQLFVLRTANQQELPPAFTDIDDIGGTEIGPCPTESDINYAINATVQNMTTQSQDLSGYSTMIANLKRDPNDKYIIGKNSYKIFSIAGKTINDPQTICINRCPKNSAQEDTIYHNSDPAYCGVFPKYYLRLIINETQQQSTTDDMVQLDIANICHETVFES